MFFLFNQIRGILDNSLNNFVWISIAVNIVILMLLAHYNFNINFLYVKKIIIIVIIGSFYFSIGTWILDYNMHGYVKSGDGLNVYIEYENITKLPIEIYKAITIGEENSKKFESNVDLEDGNKYKINTFFKEDEIKEGNSVSNIIIFKMFKFLPFVKIAKVTYSQ